MPKIGDLFIQIGADTKQFTKELKALAKNIEGFGNEVKKAGTELTKAFTAPLAGFAAAALASSKEATDAFARFGSQTKSAMGQLGTEIFRSLNLESLLEGLSDTLQDVADWFSNLSDGTKNFIATTGLLVAGIGPAVFLLGELAIVAARSAEAFKLLGGAAVYLTTNPLGVLISLLGGAAVAFGLLSLSARNASSSTRDALSLPEISRRLSEAEERVAKFRVELQESRSAAELMREGNLSAATAVSVLEANLRHAEQQAALLREQQEKLQRASKTATQSAVEAELKFLEVLRQVNVQHQNGGTNLEFHTAKLEALIAKKKAFVQIEGIEQAALQGVNAEIAEQSELVKNLESDIHKKNEAFENADRLTQAIRDQSEGFRLQGGGVNLVNQELDLQIQKYQALSQELGYEDERLVAIRNRILELQGPVQQFIGLMQTIPTLGQQIGQVLFGVVQQFSQGVGQAIAQAIVYGQSLGKALRDVLKQIAANIIATLIQIGIQRLILAILGVDSAAKDASANIGASAGRAGAAAYAASIESLGLAGLAVGPGIAAGAIATATALGAVGIGAGHAVGQTVRVAAAAESALFNRPSITTIAEREPEIALTRSKFRQFAGDALGGFNGRPVMLHVHLEANGREMAEVLVKEIPGALRYHGITI